MTAIDFFRDLKVENLLLDDNKDLKLIGQFDNYALNI